MLLLYTIMVLRHGVTPECIVEAATSRVGSGRRAQGYTTVLHYIAQKLSQHDTRCVDSKGKSKKMQ